MADFLISTGGLLDAWKYLPPTIIVVGTVGNALTLATVTGGHCKKSSFTVILASLAVFDTLVLWIVAMQMWLNTVFGIDAESSGTFLCKTYSFTSFLFPHMSSWLVVCLTVERMVGTYFPQWYKTASKPRNGLICVTVIFAFLVCLNAHLLFGNDIYSDENTTLCYFTDEAYGDFFFFYWAWVDFFVYCILPVTIIILANTATVLRVVRSLRATTTSMSDISKKKTRYLLTVTFLVSSTFVILASPQSVYIAFAPFILGDLFELTDQEKIIESVVFMLMFLNHALNFFLYTLSGPRFRQDLRKALIKCLPRWNGKEESEGTQRSDVTVRDSGKR